jgi:transposase
MALSLHQWYEIVFLHKHPKGPKLGLEAMAKYVHCSKSTVVKWVQRWEENKDLNEQPKPGRNRITTKEQDAEILRLAGKENDVSLIEIQQKMKKRKLDISVDTIWQRLRENKAKYMNKLSKSLLTVNHKEKRLQWAKDHMNFDWSQVVFTDESTFRLNQRALKVWQFPGRRKVFRSVKHPLKVNVWGCFSAVGFGKLVCFQQNLNADFMITLYKRGLIPSVNMLFGEGYVGWVLQEDNDPKHWSKLVGRWKEEEKVDVLSWPSMSPNQNPIKNVWRLMKIKIAKKKIRTVIGLKAQLRKE